jgi:choline dehydrogenase-like flavoprotein
VRYRVGNRDEVARARREVIVCGGAIGSPHLLLLSGIGPAAHLKEMGVPVVHDLPGVGQNLQDHLVYFVHWEAKRGTVRPISRGALFRSLAQWLLTRGGPFARTPMQAGGFVRTRPGLARPDLQFHFIPAAPFEPNFDDPRELSFGSNMIVFPTLIYPRSRGEIRLRSKDPAAPPAIDPRFLSDPADVDALVAGIALTREIGEHEAMRRVRGAEKRPGPSVVDPEALRASVRRHTDTVFHPAGTCAMGTVLDSALRVRGVDGLRVADASVMPTITGGNTNAPVIAIAEKAADLVRSA